MNATLTFDGAAFRFRCDGAVGSAMPVKGAGLPARSVCFGAVAVMATFFAAVLQIDAAKNREGRFWRS
ncbi:hypothetical protein J2X12_003903 [Pseudarthrobacter oxydans]|uniref:Uncharacterized protein n=1 Tax=Pseudarthrobacter oxydans TaxID=1671 RepID=A0AAW8NG12_PSEOX|nr:hypothetical protein [Pseudarthrobacter oxydans]MDR7165849.1 hypothetical protein [Pseudarthrobacter oxydans]